MPGYRICSLDADGLIRNIMSSAFEDDAAAMAAAADLTQRFTTVEVWNNGRLLKSLRKPAKGSENGPPH